MDWFLVTVFTLLILGIASYLGYKFVYLRNTCSSRKSTDRVQDWVYTSGSCLANNCVSGFRGDQCEVTITCPDQCASDKCSVDKKTCSGCTPGYGSSMNGSSDDSGQCPEYWLMKPDVSYDGDTSDDTKYPPLVVPNDDACINNCIGIPNCAFAVSKPMNSGGVECYIRSKFGNYNASDKESHLLIRVSDKDKVT